jgi:hypothetical protein
MMRSAFCFPPTKFANIARLVWEAPRKDPVSINVFLCRRGIFLPAFLHVTQKCVVIELFVARSTQRVRRAFRDERGIDFVAASYVRGVEDVITRRYVESHTLLSPSEIPSLSKPSSSLSYSRVDQGGVCRGLRHRCSSPIPQGVAGSTRHSQASGPKNRRPRRSGPGKIMHPDQRHNSPDTRHPGNPWELRRSFSRNRRFRKSFGSICGIEDVIPIGREFDSRIRDTYLFVSTAGADGSAALKRFEAFLDTQLIRDERNLRHLSYQP